MVRHPFLDSPDHPRQDGHQSWTGQSLVARRASGRARYLPVPVAAKVSQSQGFRAIRLLGLNKLGHCVARPSSLAELAAVIPLGAPPGSGPLW
jgi:hypothetical protein